MPPTSTYRVQLHAGFPFGAASALAGYLAELGVTHLYCSPVLQAVPGSTHGYDVTDPRRVSDELGGRAGFDALSQALSHAGLGVVLDIVPNHMATDRTNPFWWDVLARGHRSRYARFFDIDWTGGDERVLVPILADQYGRVLEAGGIAVERRGGEVRIRYGEVLLPVALESLAPVLGAAARRAEGAALAGFAERLESLAVAFAADPGARAAEEPVEDALVAELTAALVRDGELADALDAELAALTADTDRLDAFVRHQNYRLAFWRIASEELDYRRFFNIETLAGVRVEDPTVFVETHQVVLDLVAAGAVEGLRIDHIDGLRDPRAYLDRLAEVTGGAYTVVEKILEPGEELPEDFAAAGTSGYDFLIRVNNLFVAHENEAALTACYAELTGERADYAHVARAAKLHVMTNELAAEVDRLTGDLSRIVERHRRQRDHTRRELRIALGEFVASYPVYRTYLRSDEAMRAADRQHVADAVASAHAARPDLDPELFDFLGELAAGEHAGAPEREFALRLQQLTAPVMAKGVEDTAFYRYNRFVSLNEVGGDPGVFGRPVAHFHELSALSAERWPQAMLTLSTHDTKRSADVRARLNVLSEIPAAWHAAVARWMVHNERHRTGTWPDRNTEYLLYQNLLGAWPISAERLCGFAAKATKEAKVHTSWTEPNDAYDDALASFVGSILADAVFVADLEAFLAREQIIERGQRNALAQVALLYSCPGVADLYQGNELWDLSLVDPDNRRPVDFARRAALLAAARAGDAVPAEEGGEKLRLVSALLADRRENPALYEEPTYEPLAVSGARPDAALAFRRAGRVVVAACRSGAPAAEASVELPAGRWRHLVTGERCAGGAQSLAALLASFPVAILAAEHD